MSDNNFEFIRKHTIESLNVSCEEYRHSVTGTPHFHFDTPNDENVFLVALRTVPTDSTGVAHILEHTALCGSERYPVRDPFFMMIRRSLNTFMNAFTSSDWTAYPFASKNKKDFNNLLDVYLDAVFFSRLHELDFAQEGHRMEFETPDDPNTDLVFKGVVFNEMKGAMSSPVSTLWQTLTKYLFPSSTYHFNSGGEPECIVDLTYEQLQAFYKTHYHPSNAVFMTFGDIPAATHQEKFERQVLKRFERSDVHIQVNPEKRLLSPVRVEEYYAFDQPDQLQSKTHVVMGWMLGECTDLLGMLEAQLLTSVLLDHSASPLRLALETTDLAKSPSPLCGLEPSNREMSFVCGLEGAETDSAAAIERMILDTLEQVAKDGVPQEQVEAVLHQLELHQREIGGDGYPYGLQLILAALPAAIHRGDPIALLDLDPALEVLRERVQNPDYVAELTQRLLLNNQHRVTLSLKPDAQLSEKKVLAEKSRLASVKSRLTAEESRQIVEIAAQLKARQEQEDDDSILPKVEISDIPNEVSVPIGERGDAAGSALTSYAQGTNGLIYQQYLVALPPLDDTHMDVLPLYAGLMTELGVGTADYLTMQQRQSAVSGGVSAYCKLQGKPEDAQSVSGHFVVSGKALARNQEQLTELMRDTFAHVRFDERARIKELVSQKRARREASITNNGHGLAMLAATQRLSPTNLWSHRWSGLDGVAAIKQLDDALQQNDDALEQLLAQLKAIHGGIVQSQGQFLWIGEQEHRALGTQSMTQWASSLNTVSDEPRVFESVNEHLHQVWQTNTEVNFCAQAFRTVPMAHEDAPALNVLASYLKNECLHRTIREQGGAYGGGASQDSSSATFKFYSYRDPRAEATFDDFEASVSWLVNAELSRDALEQAILGVVGGLDKPGSPSGEAKKAFHNGLYGRTPEVLSAYRRRVVDITVNDLKRVAETYLLNQLSSKAIITNREGASAAFLNGWDFHQL